MRAVGLLLFVLAVSACRASVHEVPPTEVLLRVDASPEVRDAAVNLRVRVAVQAKTAAAWVERSPLSLPKAGAELRWPTDIPILPRDEQSPPKLFQVVAEALDGAGGVLAQERAITSFVKQAQLVLELRLAPCGGSPLGTLCEQDASCNGPSCLTCVGDVCVATPVTATDALPKLAKVGAHRDAGGAGASGSGAGGAQGSTAGKGAGGDGKGAGGSGATGAGGTGVASTTGEGGTSDKDAGDAGDAGDGMVSPPVDAGDAGDSGSPPPNTGIATSGDPCAEQDSLACSGHASKLPLICNHGSWQPQSPCDDTQRCDPSAGATLGTCLAIPSECAGKSPGDSTCEGALRRTCDADLLRLQPYDCPANAHCDSTAGVSCVCDNGYQDDGAGGCANIDDCASNPCSPGGSCTDGLLSYTCTCGSGYSGTGGTACTNIDDCPGNTCGAGGSCVDGVNAYTCNCSSGYSGTGTQMCHDIDECSQTNVCNSDFPCANLTPFYTCRGQYADFTPSDSPSSFTVNGNGTVTDGRNGLLWQQNLPATYTGCTGKINVQNDACSWDEAVAYCTSLSLAGSGWRLPRKSEFESITDYTLPPPALDPTAFPGAPSVSCWTATPSLGAPGSHWAGGAGGMGNGPSTSVYRVRCVR